MFDNHDGSQSCFMCYCADKFFICIFRRKNTCCPTSICYDVSQSESEYEPLKLRSEQICHGISNKLQRKQCKQYRNVFKLGRIDTLPHYLNNIVQEICNPSRASFAPKVYLLLLPRRTDSLIGTQTFTSVVFCRVSSFQFILCHLTVPYSLNGTNLFTKKP